MSIARRLAALAALALSGCDGSGGAPIELQPGNYDISARGAVFGFSGKMLGQGTRCISAANGAEHIPTMLVRPYMEISETCGTAKFERTGNKLTGVAVCPIEEGIVTVNFAGKVLSDGVEGDLKAKFDIRPDGTAERAQTEKMLRLASKFASMPFAAVRTGECSGSGSTSSIFTTAPPYDNSAPAYDFPDAPED